MIPKIKDIIAGNILINEQLKELSAAFKPRRIECVLLKGISLINIFPNYLKERTMDDIDLLIKPQDIITVRKLLTELGYQTANSDPGTFKASGKHAYLDICDSLWYLNKTENEQLFAKCHKYPGPYNGTFHLPPDEFYIHILAHAAVHHGEVTKKWKTDLKLAEDRCRDMGFWLGIESKFVDYGLHKAWKDYTNYENSKKLIYRINFPHKGHILRLSSLPSEKFTQYLFKMLFPSDDFLINRYGIKNDRLVYFYRVLRPFLLLGKVVSIPLSITANFTAFLCGRQSFSKECQSD